MEVNVEQTVVTKTNPVLNVNKDGTLLYSNEAGNLILNEWGVEIGEKLPLSIVDLVKRVISRNNPEKMEINAGNRTYLIVFSPLPEQELVSISGFDVSGHRELEIETQQNEERLKALMDHNPSLVFMKDECGRYVYLNKSYQKQFVHSRDWYGKTDFDFWPKESAELFRANDSFVLRSGHIHQFMEDSTDLNGTRYCWLNYKFPFTDSKNKRYVGGIGIDVIDRVRAEDAMRESEKRYHELFSSMTEMFQVLELVYNINGQAVDFYYREVNPATEKLTGKSREEMVGRRARELFGVIEEHWIQALNQVNNSGEPLHFENYSKELDKYYDFNAFKVADQENTVAIVFLDITERKRAEEEIKKLMASIQIEKDKLSALVNSIPDEVWFADTNKKFTLANLSALKEFGLVSEDIDVEQLANSLEVYRPDGSVRPVDEAPPLKSLKGEVVKSQEEIIRTPATKELRYRQVNAAPVKDINGNIIGSVSVVRDITNLKKVEDALKKAHVTLEEKVKKRTDELEKTNKILQEINIVRKKEIHHRIKNNLQVISSLLDLQAEKFRNKRNIEDSQVLEAFRESQDRVISMALIHEELYKGGGFDTLNFSQYIHELADNLFQTCNIGNNDINLKLGLEKNAFFDMDTAVPLGIIVNELVSNSFKHAFPGRNKGEIQIKLSREENEECIDCINEDCKSTSFALTVSDNGIGIAENLDMEALDSLGMQLVTSLVDQLAGELELKRGYGTEFTIRFTVTEHNNSASEGSYRK
jgi:PAS domain S-box-containing protein